MTSESGSEAPEPAEPLGEAAASSGEAAAPKPSIWERMRRGMADHNAKAPRTPLGMPEVVSEDDSGDGSPDDSGDAATEFPAGATAELVLERIHHYRDTIRSYQVLIENERVGQIRDDQTEHFVLRPGSYTLRLQLLWIFSPRVVVDLPVGTETRMICGPNGGILQAWRLFLAPTTAIFLRFAD